VNFVFIKTYKIPRSTVFVYIHSCRIHASVLVLLYLYKLDVCICRLMLSNLSSLSISSSPCNIIANSWELGARVRKEALAFYCRWNCLQPHFTGSYLKVHKIEIFFGFDFEICIISLLVMSNIKILLTILRPRFLSRLFHNVVNRSQVACLNTQKNFFVQAIIGGDTIFPLSLRLSGIEFSLVWD
jgi:hypothetical protein